MNVLPLRNRDDERPPAPDHLSPEARAWWRRILAEWVVDERGQLLLEAALEHWDRYRQAKALIDSEGPVITNPDSGHSHTHPAHAIARDSIREFRQLWRALGLQGEPLEDDGGRR